MQNIADSTDTPIVICGLSQEFTGRRVLQDIHLRVPAGTTLALLGPSGCGKSTLLKLLAGLLQPSSGEIRFGERLIASREVCILPEQRDIGMVFQDYALWPHMSVAQNVDFPLRMRRVARAERALRVATALERVGLAAFAGRKPSELSGGQQQRVALARAIVAEPRVLLFDEPLSNLDSELRESLCREMARLLRQLGITAVYVTHDRSEAHQLAHHIAHMAQGRIVDHHAV
ncbi:ABC transporter ATP-binding protein [Acerihabitans arboris]|uniref:ATP-binding cassette domain-containing protein n=1 Tax=Acerihabitans arboris TaxID=2691583 RepID=A0A845SN26_9GAMM|nr:ABC transporter ATP-binding protein [Acerihabitans arboris]NDL64011.1 ATP-binding cassette domain-containing protein [Acerihabitans arboris]